MKMTNQINSERDLRIRSAPAPVRRFSKKALLVGASLASTLILTSFGLAMMPAGDDEATPTPELYSTSHKARAEGLNALPISYAEVKPSAPILGPPLPGDLGAPILQAQREARFIAADPITPLTEPRVEETLEEETRRAEQIAEVRKSGIFFSNSSNAPSSPFQAPTTRTSAETRDPFEVLSQLSIPSGVSAKTPDPNFQERKQTFLNADNDQSIYNPYQLETPVSPWQVMSGTVISASLLTGINSDLPGQIIGQVTEPVYDTVTGQTLLVPQGSRIIGRYDSVVAYGQSRALIVWNRIIMPDGSSIRIENLPGSDARGYAGLRDKVDNHTLRIFSAAALSSLISIGAELSSDDDDEIARALRDATQQGVSRVGDEIVRRQLAVQPTIKIRPGWRLKILVHQDIILKPYGDT